MPFIVITSHLIFQTLFDDVSLVVSSYLSLTPSFFNCFLCLSLLQELIGLGFCRALEAYGSTSRVHLLRNEGYGTHA